MRHRRATSDGRTRRNPHIGPLQSESTANTRPSFLGQLSTIRTSPCVERWRGSCTKNSTREGLAILSNGIGQTELPIGSKPITLIPNEQHGLVRVPAPPRRFSSICRPGDQSSAAFSSIDLRSGYERALRNPRWPHPPVRPQGRHPSSLVSENGDPEPEFWVKNPSAGWVQTFHQVAIVCLMESASHHILLGRVLEWQGAVS